MAKTEREQNQKQHEDSYPRQQSEIKVVPLSTDYYIQTYGGGAIVPHILNLGAQ
jgi:hypothetical protein